MWLGYQGKNRMVGYIQELISYNSYQLSNRTPIASNITTHYTTGSDTDYQAFITATGITQPTQSAALETLVSDLKSYGLWSKMKAVYPMITDKYNLYSNTENLSTGWLTTNSSVTASNVAGPFTSSLVANRLNDSISSPVTLTVINNGFNYEFDGIVGTFPTLSLQEGKTYNFDVQGVSSSHPFALRLSDGNTTAVPGTTNNDPVAGRWGTDGNPNPITYTVPIGAPSIVYQCTSHASMIGVIQTVENSDQHYIYQTVQLQSGSAYVMSTHARWNGCDYIVLNPDGNSKTWFDIRNGFVSSSLGTVATASITRVSGSASNPSGSWYRCAMVFTSSVSAPYNTSIQLAETNESLTYGSLTGLSGSFLWGAQFEPGSFISPYVSNTTNNAFTTSSIFDQMKFNLKDPRDLNAAGRLVAYGTCSFGYSGIKTGPVGSRSFLTTNYTSSTIENTHFSIYRTDEPIVNGGGRTDIGITSGNATSGIDAAINIQASSTNVAGGLTARFQNPSVTVGTRKANMYIISRVPNPIATSGSYSKLYRANTLLSTYDGPLGIQNLTGNRQILIGALDFYGGLVILNGTQTNGTYPFATIGDGLTDYEAKALYWIVQKYQTTLGRQVY
jgi:hypothetical protein